MTDPAITATAQRVRELLLTSLTVLRAAADEQPDTAVVTSSVEAAVKTLLGVQRSGPPTLLLEARESLRGALEVMQRSESRQPRAFEDLSVDIRSAVEVLSEAIAEHDIDRGAADLTSRGDEREPPGSPAVKGEGLRQPAGSKGPRTGAPPRQPKPQTVFPRTAARPNIGPSGLPRVEAELGLHSESNFFTNFQGDIRDRGGVFVATWTAIAVGTACEVDLLFPGDLRAEVRGVVRWRREIKRGETAGTPGLGVEITGAEEDAWALIQRFIGKRDPLVHEM